MKIKSKKQGIQLYGEGFFGNTLRDWKTPGDLYVEPRCPAKVVLRQAAEHGGGVCVYGLGVREALELWANTFEPGLYLSEQLPGQPGNILFQGEYCYGNDGEFLRASTVKDFHRPAMLQAEDFSGAACRPVLRDNMDQSSYERLIDMAEAFEDHTIEFTLCDERVGSEKQPMIIWEVRRY